MQAEIAKFHDPVEQAGLGKIDLDPLRASLKTDEHARREAILALHRTLLGSLTAVDSRLGKAYGLGRAVADTCRKPTDQGSAQEELETYRIANLLGWLDDLSSALPRTPHAAPTSLERWRDWARTLDQTQMPDEALRVLRRQGELWRALLSGEKDGTEMLETNNYLDAARDLASHMRSLLLGVIRRFPLLMLLVAALIVGGVALLIIGGGSQTVAGATSILAALGLTWKGLGGSLGQLAGKLEQPLWGAVLDLAIADAITLLPDNKRDQRGRRALALQMSGRKATAQSESPQPSAQEE